MDQECQTSSLVEKAQNRSQIIRLISILLIKSPHFSYLENGALTSLPQEKNRIVIIFTIFKILILRLNGKLWLRRFIQRLPIKLMVRHVTNLFLHISDRSRPQEVVCSIEVSSILSGKTSPGKRERLRGDPDIQ